MASRSTGLADDDIEQKEPSDLWEALQAWRKAHPDAGWSEMDRAIEEQLDQVRRQAWEQLTTDLEDNEQKRTCPACGGGCEARGEAARVLTLPGNESLRLRRQYVVCRVCRLGRFPLDDMLGLLPGSLSPSLHEVVVRLGARLPFREVAEEVSRLFRITVSDSTTCRLTEQAGASLVAHEVAEVERLEREQPEPPPGPAVQQVSADGAMVPLRHGRWAEVKTVAIGTVLSRPGTAGVAQPRTTDISYFSRLADHETFSRFSLAELHRRGTERAGAVVAVTDGSEWLQKFIDLHRADAVRILDFPHAVEHLSAAAQARFGLGAAESTAWVNRQASMLCHGDPDLVLSALRDLPAGANNPAAAQAAADATLAYLTKRRAHIDYASFQAKGYPIGSGIIESANKVVVEARLKGSGMHWAQEHVDPLLSLRVSVCNGAWDVSWPQVASGRRSEARARTERRRRLRHEAQAATAGLPTSAPPLTPPPLPVRSTPRTAPTPKIVNGRPTSDHPWRRPLNFGRSTPARYARK